MQMQMRNAHTYTHATEFSVFCPSIIFDLQPFFSLVVVASFLPLPASINFFSFDCLHKYYGFSRVIVAIASAAAVTVVVVVVHHIMLAGAKG